MSILIRAIIITALFAVTTGLGSASAFADDETKAKMLARDHQKCVLGCVINNPGEVCQVLCDCTVDRFSTLAFADYVKLQIQMNSGRVSDENRVWLDQTALACAADVDRQFPEYAPTEDPGPIPD